MARDISRRAAVGIIAGAVVTAVTGGTLTYQELSRKDEEIARLRSALSGPQVYLHDIYFDGSNPYSSYAVLLVTFPESNFRYLSKPLHKVGSDIMELSKRWPESLTIYKTVPIERVPGVCMNDEYEGIKVFVRDETNPKTVIVKDTSFFVSDVLDPETAKIRRHQYHRGINFTGLPLGDTWGESWDDEFDTFRKGQLIQNGFVEQYLARWDF